MQEDKEGALDAAHTLEECLAVMAGMVSTWVVNADAHARIHGARAPRRDGRGRLPC